MTLHYDTLSAGAAGIVEDILKACGKEDDLRLRLAVDETVCNIVQYAYPNDGRLDVEITEQPLTITLVDVGQPFNPLEQHAPDTQAALDDRQIGGLGIFLAKQVMKDMQYRYADGTNRLTMHYE